MVGNGSFLSRHGLWVGFVAVLVPLLVLMALQYRWLVDLQDTSANARKHTLSNYLEAVSTNVEYYYRATAEKALNVPLRVFTESRVEKAAYHFKKKGPETQGARALFVYKFKANEEYPYHLYFYDWEGGQRMISTADAKIYSPVVAATQPWRYRFADKKIESSELIVSEADPENRIILNPILDDASRVVGIAGMVVDSDFFVKQVLPAYIEKSLPKFFRDNEAENLVVTLRDGRGELVMATGEVEGEDEVMRALPFVFRDWRLGLQSTYSTPEQWARGNFALNLTLSILLAVALIGGIVLALRTASREIYVSQMKADFVQNVSHELRTPLSSIRVFGEFLGLGRVHSREKIREYGDYIETESRRLTQLINNILDFSKIESGQKIYSFAEVDVGEVIDRTLKSFDVRLKHEGFEIDLERDGGPLAAHIDSEAVAQAFHNLVDNAVKYSGDSKRIAVRIGREDGCIVVSVRDFGVGISRSEQKKVFDRFHRVSTGLVHDVKGSGLGLAIVAHIAEAHGGKVTVESEPGNGSEFSIHLPLDSGLATDAARAVPAIAPSGKS
jgi:two-component system phosphate regulon sensor histidine kinase PhoR